MPCVEHSDRQTCLEGFISGPSSSGNRLKNANLRYAHWYAHDTHRRIYMYYAAGRRPCSPISENSNDRQAGENTEHRRSAVRTVSKPCLNSLRWSCWG